MTKSIKRAFTGIAFLITSAIATADTPVNEPPAIVCWDVTCQICEGDTCSKPFRAPKEICHMDGVTCA